MQFLLDTHAILWWLDDDPALGKLARAAIEDAKNTILVSAASAWEIATKVRIGKLASALALADDFVGSMMREGFETLPITADHAIRAGLLPGSHRDPFDRMLVAQAQAEHLAFVSNETIFDTFGVRRVW